MATMWRGLLAPLGVPTGDDRRFMPDGVTTRPLPLPLKWQREDTYGHSESVIIGSLQTATVLPVSDAITQEFITAEAADAAGLASDTLGLWGSGELFDDTDMETVPRLAEDVAECLVLLGKKVIGPSVDITAADVVLVVPGSDQPLTEGDLEELWMQSELDGTEVKLEQLFLTAEVAAATLVGIPAFGECRPFETYSSAAVSLTAAVRSDGWAGMPLADREAPWDGPAAAKRVEDRCTADDDTIDYGCYATGFLYVDDSADPETLGAYGFGICDIIDDEQRIVPRGVFAVAGVLQGARGGTTIPEADQTAMEDVVTSLYERMAKEFDDPTIVAPWVTEQAAARRETYAALSSEPRYPAGWFADPKLPAITPITVTEDGRVFGHVATHDVCHAGIPGMCMTAPVDSGDYSAFNRYPIDLSDGSMVTAGRLTVGHGKTRSCACCRGNDDHACTRISAGASMAHHDAMTTVAHVRAYEDTANNAIVVAGAISPTADRKDLAALQRRRVSGDWRQLGGSLSLVEVLILARERPGFPLPRGRSEAGRMAALTAACPVHVVDQPAAAIDVDALADRVASRVLAALQPAPAAAVAEPTSGGSDQDLAAAAGETLAYIQAVSAAHLAAQIGTITKEGSR